MRVVATSMLVAAATVFVATQLLGPRLGHPTWLGYVEAASEAAMVGGLADWFAVVAIFRHPLGIPIPHTAIVPRRKDAIGVSLGTFVRENFLASEQLVERVRAADPVGRSAAWVAAGNADRVAEGILRAASSVAAAVDDDEVNGFLHELVAERVRAVPAARAAAAVIELTMADGRRDQLLDAALGGVVHVLDANRPTLRARFAQESPWWVPEGIDERVFTRLYDGIRRLLADVRDDHGHELRRQIDGQLDTLVARLREEPELAARVEHWRDQVLASPELRAATASAWASVRAAVARAADDQTRTDPLRRSLADAAERAAVRVAADEVLRRRADDALSAAVRAVASAGGREIAALIATTVQRWDAADTGRRMEQQVGRDLQFVRINGTIVGGLAGLLLHVVAEVL